MRTLVLLNRGADGGKAVVKWRRVESGLRGLLGESRTVCVETEDWAKAVGRVVNGGRGDCLIVAAGGDGTVQKVANLVLALPSPLASQVAFGAIGLGSSNDFHKPRNGVVRDVGVPVRCAVAGAAPQNVLRVDYTDEGGVHQIVHAVANCSLGMVAVGNDLFNRRSGLMGFCRKLGSPMGIAVASLAGLFCGRGPTVRLRIDGGDVYGGGVSLFGAYVNPNFAGRLRYAGPTSVSSDHMGILLAPEIGLWRRVRLFRRASGGGLGGGGDVQTWAGTSCEMALSEASPLEMDGEVVRAREVRITLVPGALRVCR
jgi:diacylglycerol kinase family enzyme